MVQARMTKSELAEVVDFIGKKFDAQKGEFHRLELRFEGMQDDIQLLAEGLAGTNERLGRLEERLEALETTVGEQTILIKHLDVRFDRFDSDFRVDRLDMQRRLKALEN